MINKTKISYKIDGDCMLAEELNQEHNVNITIGTKYITTPHPPMWNYKTYN